MPTMRMLRIISLLIPLMMTVSATPQAQEKSAVIRLDPAWDDIVPSDVKVETLASGYKFLEGPVWIRRGGYLIFSDMDDNKIHKWSPTDSKVTIFLEKPSSISREEPGSEKVITGANGITVDRQGRIVYCSRGDLQVVRLEEDGRRTVLAGPRYEGKELYRPNDIVYRSDGSFYFTEPARERGKGEDEGRVFLVRDGTLRKLTTPRDMRTNGLALTPDEKSLYIVDSGGKKRIMRFEVQPDGTIANGQIFVDMSAETGSGNPDGMKVDQKGNVYVQGPGGLWIISPKGKRLGTISIPESFTNVAFGDADGKTLYLTGHHSLYRIRLKVPGVLP